MLNLISKLKPKLNPKLKLNTFMVTLLCGLSFSAVISENLQAKEILKQRSIYRNVVISENNDIRCMRFETRRKQVTNQACIDLEQPDRLVFEYSHGLLAGYALMPKPKRILIIGLGGGVLSNVMHEISPQAEIVNVDIDPVVVKLAKSHFKYIENDKVSSEIKDGRVYVKRALLKKQQFDWIVLDAFNGDYIPEHLMTQEFLTEVKGLLTDDGILTANTFSTSALYDYESVTYQKVFGDLQIYHAPTKGNRVIFANKKDTLQNFPDLNAELKQQLKIFSVESEQVKNRIDNIVDWDVNSEVLTDQYSPANLLKNK